jgi:hypothetical protein
MATFSKHISEDWCHLCGSRSANCVDISYSENAEHNPTNRGRYVRICANCLHTAFIIVRSEWIESAGVQISETVPEAGLMR